MSELKDVQQVERVDIMYRQVGWMPCVACSDAHKMKFGQKKGQMWLGKDSNRADMWIDCPACGGKGEVAKYQIINAITHEEIDYETFGRDQYGNPIPPDKFQVQVVKNK